MILHDTGRGGEALPWHERQLSLAREAGNRREEASAINNIGNVHRAMRRYDEARAHHEQYLALARELKDRGAEAIALGNLGHGAHDRGDVEEARRLHGQQLELARATGHRRTEARALGALAIDAKHLGLFEEAEGRYERYIAVSREIDHRIGVAYGQVNLARLVAREGDLARARELLLAARPLLEEAGSPGAQGFARFVLGEVEAFEGRPDEAARRFAEALALFGEKDTGRAETLVALGQLRGDATMLDEALKRASRENLPDVKLAAACARALLPGGQVAAAKEAYEECGPRVAWLSRMDAAFLLFQITRQRRHLDAAREMLRHVEEHAPAARRAALRAHRLQARILVPRPPSSVTVSATACATATLTAMRRLALFALLAACGGGGGSSAPGTRVVSVTPGPESTAGEPPTSITVKFDTAVNPDTFNQDTFQLTWSGGDGVFDNGNDVTLFTTTLSFPKSSTVVLDLSTIPLPDEVFRLRLVGTGTRKILAADGLALDGEFSGTFPSGDGVEGGDFEMFFRGTTTVESMTPAPASTVSPPGTVIVGISSDVDPATVSAASIPDRSERGRLEFLERERGRASGLDDHAERDASSGSTSRATRSPRTRTR